MIGLWLKGYALGWAIAMPIGPIGVLTIRRTLASGWARGVFTGLGAATADSCYGLVAALGLQAVSSVLVAYQTWLHLLGGLFLIYLGIKTFRSRPLAVGKGADGSGGSGSSGGDLAAAWGSTFFLTLTNPATIMAFAVVFAGLGLAGEETYLAALVMVSGLFCGSASWFGLLSSLVNLFRKRFNQAAMVWVNRLSGAVILAFGLVAWGAILYN